MTQKEYLTDSKGKIIRYQNGEPVPLEGWDNEPLSKEELRAKGLVLPDEILDALAEKIGSGEPWGPEDLMR